MRWIGAVLAGGASRRMGTDKAQLLLDGQPLWRRQADVLRRAGAEPVVIIRRPSQSLPWDGAPAPSGLTVARDRFAAAGPLAGLEAALTAAPGPVGILGVDMPGIDFGWFRWLAEFCRPGVGAIVRHGEAFEPLAAFYPREALPEIRARLARRDLSLQRLVAALAGAGRLTVQPLAARSRERVASWNSPRSA